eukprot:246964-Amphidinium_carterae.1
MSPSPGDVTGQSSVPANDPAAIPVGIVQRGRSAVSTVGSTANALQLFHQNTPSPTNTGTPQNTPRRDTSAQRYQGARPTGLERVHDQERSSVGLEGDTATAIRQQHETNKELNKRDHGILRELTWSCKLLNIRGLCSMNCNKMLEAARHKGCESTNAVTATTAVSEIIGVKIESYENSTQCSQGN